MHSWQAPNAVLLLLLLRTARGRALLYPQDGLSESSETKNHINHVHCQAVANASPRRHLRAGHTPASSQARAPRLLRVVAAVSRQPEDGNGGSASLAGAAAAFFC